MSKAYTYQPLQGRQIRLLKIVRDDNRFQFELTSVSLDDSPEYTAISYTWGSSDRTHKLHHNRDGIVLPITKSAYDVINNVSDEYPVLWIDMICINQDDNKEKAVQVGMMGLVYQKSSHTVAYLSKPPTYAGDSPQTTDEDDDTRILFERYKWRRSKHPLSRSIMSLWDLQHVDNEVSAGYILRLLFKQVTSPITAMFPPPWPKDWRQSSQNLQQERPYFFRKWIIQEVIRAPSITFQAGSHKMDLADLGALGYGGHGNVFDLKNAYPSSGSWKDTLKVQDSYLYALRAKDNALYMQAKEAQSQDYSEQRISSSQAFRLLTLLVDTAGFNVTNVRDKLFAIEPLLDDQVPVEIGPDYDASPEEIFRRLTRFLLCNNAAEALALIRYGHNDNLPSWCIDWSQAIATRSAEYAGTFPGSLRAGYTTTIRRQMIRADREDALLMRGRQVHTVRDIKGLSHAEWNTLMQDNSKLVSEQGADVAMALYFWRDRVVQNDEPFGGEPFASVIDAGGLIGLVPKRAQPGDVLVIIMGLQPLYLLRQVRGSWQIIGECFAPAYMKGEQLESIVRAYDESPVAPWQDFRVV